MTKIKLLTLAVVGLLVLNLCIVGFLVFGPPRHSAPLGLGHHGPKNKIIELLHFDNDQIEAYEKLIEQHRAAVRQLDRQIRDTKKSLYQMLHAKDSSKKDSLVNQLGELQMEIERVHYHHFEDIRQLCKPDQQKYFEELTHSLAEFFDHSK